MTRLGPGPWPTVDPFLFCVHHLDRYPAADGAFGPVASLQGRQLGQDFSGTDGWSMYHGAPVPGFPQHPHRGFETISFVRRGLIDHSDSLGATARFGRGDVQWMTAGAGIVHSEMFPLLDTEGPNTLEMFQIWLNLPADGKLVDPHFTMLWAEDIPRVTLGDGAGTVTVIAGEGFGVTPPSAPPASWASRPDARIGIWHLVLEAGGEVTLPAAADDVGRVAYVFEGDTAAVDGEPVPGYSAAELDAGAPSLVSTGAEPAEILVLQGRPIGEPVSQYGPFVMNTSAEIGQAIEDYRRTGFGGWPWPDDGPVHGTDPTRFARHADGTISSPV